MEEIRAVFEKVISTVQDPDRKDELELCREYYTNPEFKKYLEDMVWKMNN